MPFKSFKLKPRYKCMSFLIIVLQKCMPSLLENVGEAKAHPLSLIQRRSQASKCGSPPEGRQLPPTPEGSDDAALLLSES